VDEGEPVDGTAPAEDEALVPDPQEEPPGSLQVGMPELDPPQSEHGHSPLPSRNDLDDDGNPQCMPDPEHGNEDGQQEDDDTAPGHEAQPDNLPSGPNNWNPDDLVPHLDALRVLVDFIKGIEGASLNNDPLPGNIWECLWSPSTTPPLIDANLRMCLGIFLETTNGSQATYDSVCQFIKQRYPDANTLSYDQMKRKLAELTGVVPVMTNMCFDTCMAFAGPYSELRACPECHNPWFETVTQGNKRVSVPCRQAFTIPVGPQIWAQYRSCKSAWNMGHWNRVMEPLLAKLRAGSSLDVYDDVYCSSILLDAAQQGDLLPDDTVLMLSINGAQLYKSKQSDCWIYIWVLFDLTPDLRYKKKYVLPGGFIPGPKKPKNMDSFIYTGLHHLSALQRDGLWIWDCATGCVFTSRPFFFWALLMDLVSQLCTGKSDTMALLDVVSTAAWEGDTSQGGLITTLHCLSLQTITLLDVATTSLTSSSFRAHLRLNTLGILANSRLV
jgi:hypothetical protein